MATDRWSLRNIYMYLVCLITLIMVIVAAVGFVRGIVELIYPDTYYYGYYDVATVEDKESGITEAQIEAEQEAQEKSARRYAVLSLVGNGAMLLIAGPLYIYHWRKIEIEHDDGGKAVEPTTA